LLSPARRNGITIAATALVLAALTWWNAEWPLWFFIWLLGTFAAHLFETKAIDVRIGIAGLVICAGALVLSRLGIVALHATDLIAAFGITAAVSCRGLMKIGSGIPAISRGAAFSYSLYLIHLPTGIFIGALYERFAGWPSRLVQPDFKGLLGFAVMIGVVLFIANLFARLTEDHTTAFRRKLMSLRTNSGRAPSAG
jgi:hypothetical protein